MLQSVPWISSFMAVNLLVFCISTNVWDPTWEDVSADEFDDLKEWLLIESLKTKKTYLSRKRYTFFLVLFCFKPSLLIHSMINLMHLFIDLLINTDFYICWTEVWHSSGFLSYSAFGWDFMVGCQLNADVRVGAGVCLFFRSVFIFDNWFGKKAGNETKEHWNKTLSPRFS